MSFCLTLSRCRQPCTLCVKLNLRWRAKFYLSQFVRLAMGVFICWVSYVLMEIGNNILCIQCLWDVFLFIYLLEMFLCLTLFSNNGLGLLRTRFTFLAATKQLYEWYFRPSVCHTFLTMFPSSYHHEIFRSYYQGPGYCPCKRSRSEVKGQGHRGHYPT